MSPSCPLPLEESDARLSPSRLCTSTGLQNRGSAYKPCLWLSRYVGWEAADAQHPARNPDRDCCAGRVLPGLHRRHDAPQRAGTSETDRERLQRARFRHAPADNPAHLSPRRAGAGDAADADRVLVVAARLSPPKKRKSSINAIA